ncbi:excisionase family DNA-binding protein [Sphingomonas sp. CBMAI 2297]|uniref:excisionase family DNA-binding protein n=1 Tax=Sphingomonas sp. CBMAI 2297 TaxID=2991720 RepID=UPI002454DF9E|nr:excisionase family DNA-binding protein [Sphingomonas sp. CBMAI 2297]MDH4746219.1 excisionase family DNA-binding protein [Sphingomonas sp. CBMAI 2297]
MCVTVDEAAELLLIGRSKMCALIADGSVETIKLGKSTRVVVLSLDLLLARNSG